MCRKAVVAYFEVVSRHLCTGTEHNHQTRSTVVTYSSGPKFEFLTCTSTRGLRPTLDLDIRCMAQIPWLSWLLALVKFDLYT
jgi:hypothetical protein